MFLYYIFVVVFVVVECVELLLFSYPLNHHHCNITNTLLIIKHTLLNFVMIKIALASPEGSPISMIVL